MPPPPQTNRLLSALSRSLFIQPRVPHCSVGPINTEELYPRFDQTTRNANANASNSHLPSTVVTIPEAARIKEISQCNFCEAFEKKS
ncbi:hypothetical protein TcWFU_004009 [Taenia crassiceps]|uniref:Uncharacterized protein n=1 Tax=Taenia crassiceps TaxID=6207 RepID=A0ABR4QKH6_9CEST